MHTKQRKTAIKRPQKEPSHTLTRLNFISNATGKIRRPFDPKSIISGTLLSGLCLKKALRDSIMREWESFFVRSPGAVLFLWWKYGGQGVF